MVACKNILNYEAEVQNTLSYINFNSSTMGKAKKKCKKSFFCPFHKHLNLKKGPSLEFIEIDVGKCILNFGFIILNIFACDHVETQIFLFMWNVP